MCSKPKSSLLQVIACVIHNSFIGIGKIIQWYGCLNAHEVPWVLLLTWLILILAWVSIYNDDKMWDNMVASMQAKQPGSLWIKHSYHQYYQTQGLYSLRGKTCLTAKFREAWEPQYWEISAALQLRCLANFRAIWKILTPTAASILHEILRWDVPSP